MAGLLVQRPLSSVRVFRQRTGDGSHPEKALPEEVHGTTSGRGLAVYAAAGRGEGLDVAAAYLHELGTSTRRPVDIAAPTTLSAVESMARAVSEIRQRRFQASPELEKCRRCDFLKPPARRGADRLTMEIRQTSAKLDQGGSRVKFDMLVEEQPGCTGRQRARPWVSSLRRQGHRGCPFRHRR